MSSSYQHTISFIESMSDVECVSCERIVELEQKEREHSILEQQLATAQQQYMELLKENTELLEENANLLLDNVELQKANLQEHICCRVM